MTKPTLNQSLAVLLLLVLTNVVTGTVAAHHKSSPSTTTAAATPPQVALNADTIKQVVRYANKQIALTGTVVHNIGDNAYYINGPGNSNTVVNIQNGELKLDFSKTKLNPASYANKSKTVVGTITWAAVGQPFVFQVKSIN